MIDYLYYGLFLFALILMYFALKQFNITKDLLSNGIITKATVTDLIKFLVMMVILINQFLSILIIQITLLLLKVM